MFKEYEYSSTRFIKVNRQIGSLEADKIADLIVVNPDSAGMLPVHDPVTNMVCSIRVENVESDDHNDQWLMKNHKILTLNEQEIIREAKQRASAITQQAGIRLPDWFFVVDK